MTDPQQELKIVPPLIARTLFAIVLILVLCGLISNFLSQAVSEYPDLQAMFMRQFELPHEHNIPAWFSTLLLFGNACLLGVLAFSIYSRGARWVFHWAGLALIFLVLSLDEMVSIHERIGLLAGRFVDAGGVFTFAWVIPAWLFLTILAVVYLRFLLNPPNRTWRLFILAAGVYVHGGNGNAGRSSVQHVSR